MVMRGIHEKRSKKNQTAKVKDIENKFKPGAIS
jgi:hypothetical protein